jgi:hypothetical protein
MISARSRHATALIIPGHALQIVAGLEPENTNAFLQMLARAAAVGPSADAVQVRVTGRTECMHAAFVWASCYHAQGPTASLHTTHIVAVWQLCVLLLSLVLREATGPAWCFLDWIA